MYTGGAGYAESYHIARDAFRLTAFAELDFVDRASDRLGSLLGRHVLTGLYSNSKRELHVGTYMNLRASPELAIRRGRTDPSAVAGNHERASWLTYLSPSLSGASSLVGANIPGITAVQDPQYADNALLWNQEENAFQSGQRVALYNYNNPDQRDDVWTWGNNGVKEEVDSLALVLQSYLLSDKLVSTVSWRTDDATQFTGSARNNPVTNLVELPGTPIYGANPILDVDSSSWSYGVVGHAPDFINEHLPADLNLSAHFNNSENFNASAAGRNLYGEGLPFPTGETEEWGLSLYNSKFSLRFNKFKTQQVNATINFPGEIALWGGFVNIYHWNTPEEIAASGLVIPQEIVEAVNFEPNGQLGSLGAPAYGLTNPVQANVKETQDYTSEGFEIEATYSPLPNWSIAMNVAKVESITANTAPTLTEFIERVMVPMWENPNIGGSLYVADRGPENNPDNLFGARGVDLLNQVRGAQARDGAVINEARKYRVNLLTNYDFAEGGKFDGFNVGAGVRYQGKVSLGNPLIEIGPGIYGPDVTSPYYGPSEINADAWAGYRSSFNDGKIDWSLVLRVRNIGVGNELIPTRANPDGSIFEARIAESEVWELTNSFSF